MQTRFYRFTLNMALYFNVILSQNMLVLKKDQGFYQIHGSKLIENTISS